MPRVVMFSRSHPLRLPCCLHSYLDKNNYAYRDLAPGAGFVLVNDHDPKPLRYQFEAEHAGQFTWQYLDSGPEVWRVRIGRAGA